MDKEERMEEMKRYNIPDHTVGSLTLWIHNALEPGSFLKAVICNDLLGAFIYADDVNKKHIGDIISYMYNRAPMNCWRSKENYMSWEGLDNEG